MADRPSGLPGLRVPDAVASAMARVADDPRARPYAISIALDGPERLGFAVVPLDITDAELLWYAGQVVINGRNALLAQRQQDELEGTRRIVPIREIAGLHAPD